LCVRWILESDLDGQPYALAHPVEGDLGNRQDRKSRGRDAAAVGALRGRAPPRSNQPPAKSARRLAGASRPLGQVAAGGVELREVGLQGLRREGPLLRLAPPGGDQTSQSGPRDLGVQSFAKRVTLGLGIRVGPSIWCYPVQFCTSE
jgi:hypothetical protein